MLRLFFVFLIALVFSMYHASASAPRSREQLNVRAGLFGLINDVFGHFKGRN